MNNRATPVAFTNNPVKRVYSRAGRHRTCFFNKNGRHLNIHFTNNDVGHVDTNRNLVSPVFSIRLQYTLHSLSGIAQCIFHGQTVGDAVRVVGKKTW